MNRHSVELKSLANRDYPPPPAGASLREWFAGLVLGNPDLMRDVSPTNRASEAVRLADELIQALSAPRSPSRESMQPPSPAQMETWDAAAQEESVVRSRATVPRMRPVRSPTPPPVRRATGEHFAAATQILRSVDSPLPPKPCGGYSVINPDD